MLLVRGLIVVVGAAAVWWFVLSVLARRASHAAIPDERRERDA